MTEFHAICQHCNLDQQQHISEIVLVHYGDIDDMSYRFHCLECGEKNDRPATPRVVATLEACGVRVFRLDREYDEGIELLAWTLAWERIDTVADIGWVS